MLVISRKRGEGVFIGRGVRITILESRSGEVRLGIEAPKHIAVSRDDFSLEQHLKFQEKRTKNPEV